MKTILLGSRVKAKVTNDTYGNDYNSRYDKRYGNSAGYYYREGTVVGLNAIKDDFYILLLRDDGKLFSYYYKNCEILEAVKEEKKIINRFGLMDIESE